MALNFDSIMSDQAIAKEFRNYANTLQYGRSVDFLIEMTLFRTQIANFVKYIKHSLSSSFVSSWI